ncbi:MAG TPA: serpin family protein [Candidatus Acidoferrum sp.]
MPSIFSRLRKRTSEQPQRATYEGTSTLPSTQFAFSLFETLKPGDRNLAISPYSARVVLSMLCEGSTGETRKSLLETLRLDENPENQSNHYERLGRPLGFQLETETERRGLEMLTANSLLCDQGFVLKQDYVNTVKEHYLAEVQTLDFRAHESARRVNAWAHEKTRGRIPTVVDSLAGFSPLLAMNAVYFKGLWIKPFEAEKTREEEFTLLDGKKKLVPAMRQSGEFRYAEIGGAQIVRLPYKGGMSMRVVLPPKHTPFPKFCAELTSIVGTSWTRVMAERDGHLRLPRSRIETQADLSAPLRAMGMSQVFDPARATLEGISDRKPLYLMGAKQADFVEVNEKGTEAAAVTSLRLGAALNPPPPPPPFEMIVNRPFVFAICDDLSGAVVFLGAVVDPLAG